MKTMTAIAVATAIVFPAIVAAQIKTLPGESITVTATIEAIETSTRSVTLKGEDGKLTTIRVPDDVKRFSELKVGDVITARYYENIVLRLKKPDEPAVDTTTGSVTPRPGTARPGATAATQRTITATITAIDPKAPSVTLSGPSKWNLTARVADKSALEKVKVGDRLDVTWTEAVMLSADPPKPK